MSSSEPAEASSKPEATQVQSDTSNPLPMSKSALKRLWKQEKWEAGIDDRRKRRKEKRHERKVRARDERAALIAQGVDPAELQKKKQVSTLAPVGIIVDCDFEDYMMDKERVSLSSQVTRAYSDNKAARYRSHLWVAGFNKGIAKRFHEVLLDQHKKWKGIWFDEGDYISCAAKIRERMSATDGSGGEMIESLQRSLDEPTAWTRDETDPFPMPGPEPPLDEANKDVVYLSSDSPYTLERLEPNTCYVVGGLVDKNREKGLCYRRAREKGIRTARLPIGQFMVMQSRQVLATNHVVEIMLKWLECGDWGQAFLSVIPKRKGGKLRSENGEAEAEDGEEAEGKEDEDENQGEAEVEEVAEASESKEENAVEVETSTNVVDESKSGAEEAKEAQA
ncbi:tRNA (guanine-N(1)-)-methyltransferase [Trichoderma gamsii]|uniref:tRNA (guanine(9)-N1)-methyltransferase n=1 Tax=Trichoderma gamsii TaxID=398673 RepID=A0A2P4ZCH0_9HYPO|nr:tRNA (guanine-N(1)-)-methyltransferase [Trichoderma gamsii]PON21994.1 tRNA (guanine-N(1)-)-methyltransferase [Trichoderma gamsii]